MVELKKKKTGRGEAGFGRKEKSRLGRDLRHSEKAQNVFGMKSWRRKEDKEAWWWNGEVQNSRNGKKDPKKKWDRQGARKAIKNIKICATGQRRRLQRQKKMRMIS